MRSTIETKLAVTEVGPAFDMRTFLKFDVQGSSVVEFIAYDHSTRTARVGLKRAARKFSTDGTPLAAAVYEYANVPGEDVLAFLAAESKGSHFAKVWKGKYDRVSRPA